MRIIAGSLKGRIVADAKSASTHPMSEKIRGALFNVLGDVSGLTLLDAYAGTGSVAIEACSRGCVGVVAVDADQDAFKAMRGSLLQLGIGNSVHVVCANIATWVHNNQQQQFDIVVADPPYDAVKMPQLEVLASVLGVNGTLVLSLPSSTEAPEFSGLQLLKQKIFGTAQLLFYKRTD